MWVIHSEIPALKLNFKLDHINNLI